MSDAVPNRCQAVSQYRKRAAGYDRCTLLLDRYRRRAVERLLLGTGDVVIDVACGTGANFALLEQYVGPSGLASVVDVILSSDESGRTARPLDAALIDPDENQTTVTIGMCP